MAEKIVVLYNKDLGHRLRGGAKVDLTEVEERAAKAGLDVEVINETDRLSDYTIPAPKRGATHSRRNAAIKEKK